MYYVFKAKKSMKLNPSIEFSRGPLRASDFSLISSQQGNTNYNSTNKEDGFSFFSVFSITVLNKSDFKLYGRWT